MNSKQIFLIVLFVQTVVTLSFREAAAKKGGSPTSEEILEGYSLEQLEEVAIYLNTRVESDPLPKEEKIIECDPPMAKVNTWLAGPLPKLIEERRTLEIEDYLKKPVALKSRIHNCAKRCMCESYGTLLETVQVSPSFADSPEHQANLKLLKQEKRKASLKFLRKCAEKVDWFCDSDLQKYLARPRSSKGQSAKKNK